MSLRVGIIGCGLIGVRRAGTAVAAGDAVVAVADLDANRAEQLASSTGAAVAGEWRELLNRSDVDAVVVATHNAALAEMTIGAVGAGKHVLCEKPFGITAEEAAAMVTATRAAGVVVKVGFTLRHHDGISRARQLVDDGTIGQVVAMRAAYGHGGRPGYENEWRGNPALSGGGELLDQGVHLLDLARWFVGEFTEVTGALGTWGWPVDPLEDNAFALLRTDDGRVASLHTSWTQWRNLFRLELLGTAGSITVEGLGGSYGPERLSWNIRRPQGGVPDQFAHDVHNSDAAWQEEWGDFAEAIRAGGEPLTTAEDGYEAARLVDAIYASARDGRTIKVEAVGVR